MFLGHYGVAFAAKRLAPRTSLGTLTFAAQWLDELWPVLRLTVARDRVGRFALWAFVGLQVALYAGTAFGPPPPNVRTIAISALGLWLFVPWAAWIDRHRIENRE